MGISSDGSIRAAPWMDHRRDDDDDDDKCTHRPLSSSFLWFIFRITNPDLDPKIVLE